MEYIINVPKDKKVICKFYDELRTHGVLSKFLEEVTYKYLGNDVNLDEYTDYKKFVLISDVLVTESLHNLSGSLLSQTDTTDTAIISHHSQVSDSLFFDHVDREFENLNNNIESIKNTKHKYDIAPFECSMRHVLSDNHNILDTKNNVNDINIGVKCIDTRVRDINTNVRDVSANVRDVNANVRGVTSLQREHHSSLEKQLQSLNDKFDKVFNTSSSAKKGKLGERVIERYIEERFPDCQLKNVSSTGYQSDFIMTWHDHKTLIEVKFYEKNVGKLEIDKFHRDIGLGSYDGAILIALTSGIYNCGYFSCDMYDGIPVIYLPKADPCDDRIYWGVCGLDIIIQGIRQVELLRNNGKYDINDTMSIISNHIASLASDVEVLGKHNDNMNQYYISFKKMQRYNEDLCKTQSDSINNRIDMLRSYIETGKLVKDPNVQLVSSDVNCKGICVNGSKCKNKAIYDKGYCKRHMP